MSRKIEITGDSLNYFFIIETDNMIFHVFSIFLNAAFLKYILLLHLCVIYGVMSPNEIGKLNNES